MVFNHCNDFDREFSEFCSFGTLKYPHSINLTGGESRSYNFIAAVTQMQWTIPSYISVIVIEMDNRIASITYPLEMDIQDQIILRVFNMDL